ncbi:MAG: succinate dehydrogenase/fumarate reductase iron-sulfur subunit [Actinobacteria bacterium]|nr:succinate dehydrogenase/fumarate reductase iron-sulfur subunit [Actinomycetota bacterium]
MARKVKMRIWRGDSKNGEFKDVTVDANEGEVVLDVIHRVQATQMSDLAVRWNCKAGKCGSCSMEINGKPRLACMTRMNMYGEDETITVTPLRAFPVIKDLVTDVSFNYKKAMEVPAFEGPEDLKPGEYRMQQVDMHPLDRLRNRKQKAQEEHGLGMCNITKCCTEVCPEHIKITDNAIIPMKERVVDVKYDPVRWLGSKIRKREGIE